MAKSIIIAEDDAGTVEAYKILLSPVKDLSVYTCISAEDAIDRMHSFRYDAAIFDNGFGEGKMEGIESLPIIREFDKITPIFMISYELTKEDAIKAGATDYADKGDWAEASRLILGKIIPYLNSLQPAY
ncbi:MAG: response regulator [Candidatus Pacearchaeota archaeon]|nr:response regulator [Candidatus Pacearchaeota archaeon]MDE1848986.1 response regulator [Nanoarchaeota archaeon]